MHLSPIKTLLLISTGLHLAGTAISMVMATVLQRPLGALFSTSFPQDEWIFPPLVIIVPMFVLLALHLLGAGIFLKLEGEGDISKLKTLATVYGAVICILPVISFVWGHIFHGMLVFRRSTVDELTRFITMQQITNYGQVVSNVGTGLLLAAMAMLWYYCYSKEKEKIPHA